MAAIGARGRVRRLWARRGFTTRASCLFAAGVTAIVCGVVLGEVNLLRAGVLAAVVPWVAAVAVARAKLRIGVRRSAEPARANAGETITVTVNLTNTSPLPTATLLVEDKLPEQLNGRARFVLPPLRRHEQRSVSYRVPAVARGRYRIGPLQVQLCDPFGLVQVTRAFTSRSDVLVAPVVEPLGVAGVPRVSDRDGATAGQGLGMHGADDASTREYRVGDDLRKIHWRSTARTGAVMVRQEEQLWQRRSAVLLDLRTDAHAVAGADGADGADGPAHDVLDPRQLSSLEWAVSAAASLGAAALQTGRSFALAADPTVRRPVTYSDVESLLGDLADVRSQQAGSPVDLLKRLRALGESATVVAVLGRMDAATVHALMAATPRGRHSAPLALVLDVDSWSRPDARTRPPTTSLSAAEAAAVLAGAGWRPTLVRRGDLVAGAWAAALGAAGTFARRPEAVR